MPCIQVLDDLEPAMIDDLAVKLGEPRPQVMGDAVGNPQPYLVTTLYRVFPPVRLFDTHAEDPADGLAAEGRGVFFAILTVEPGRHHAATCLAVGEQRGRE